MSDDKDVNLKQARKRRRSSSSSSDDDNNSKKQVANTVKHDKVKISKPTLDKSDFVPVMRTKEIDDFRSKLPIICEEQNIMENINYNDVVILCGETGSGKTTQVPQFLYEAGYAKAKMIGITEPRRVAAMAMAKRVSEEMNLSEEIVSYQIRFEGNATDKTKIKYMTDGVLLKEIQKDLLLNKYSIIIIDEAHERSIHSDILIGLLSRIVGLRKKKEDPLKIIIMSATLKISDFTENHVLFKVQPPVTKIESRQYSVTVHFSKRTPEDYLHEAYIKVCKIHRKLPPGGGILVFVTGRREVLTLCHRLKRTFPFLKDGKNDKEKNVNNNVCDNDNDDKDQLSLRLNEVSKASRKNSQKIKAKKNIKSLNDILPKIDLDSYATDMYFSEDVSDEDEDPQLTYDEFLSDCKDPLYCLPLYSNLHEKKQKRIFQDVPNGCRLCVVSTNIAETSLTIPYIKYVVDTGKVKTKLYDKVSGISTFKIEWISKASANQRAGRAGRMGPGDCFRLYSSSMFKENFQEFSEPEILRKPIDDLVLQMKAMCIENVANFPFPTSPAPDSLKASEERLVMLGALEEKKISLQNKKTVRKITPLGKTMSVFPVSPRFAKMLLMAFQHNLINYAIAIVSGLTVKEIFINIQDEEASEGIVKKQQINFRKKWAHSGESYLLGDIMVLLRAIGSCEFIDNVPAFCERYGLRLKAINEIRKMRKQLCKEISMIFNNIEISHSLKIDPPNEIQIKCLRQLMLVGLFDHIARKIPENEIPKEEKSKYKNSYQSIQVPNVVFISFNSVLAAEAPEWVAYQEIFETNKLYMRNIIAIEPSWLPLFSPKLCKFSEPLEIPSPRYDKTMDCVKCTVHCTFGSHNWILPDTEIEYPEGLDKYKWFARFLLEGLVIDYFKENVKLLLSSPSIMLKSWAKLKKRTELILNALIENKICTKKSLVEQWKNNSRYLFKEYCEWIPEAYHWKIEEIWPPK